MIRQLRMIWPKKLLGSYPQIKLLKDYELRSFREGDEKMYVELMRKAGFENWPAERVQNILNNPLSPDGVYFITFHGKLVATACALDRTPENERGAENLVGELGWVACDPAYRGKHLGKMVCATVVNYLLSHNYCSIFLLTDDWRLAAIKTYLELGFEPVRNTGEMQHRWEKVCDNLGWKLSDIYDFSWLKTRRREEEIALKTLYLEPVDEPCITASWCMKRDFFRHFTGKEDIYKNAVDVVVETFVHVGANLCPQFIMPSPQIEHIACDPFEVAKLSSGGHSGHTDKTNIVNRFTSHRFTSPEEVRDWIERLPDPKKLEKEFNVERVADDYARRLKLLRKKAQGEILFIGDFGQADFMGPYLTWGYENYLTALALYPDHLKRYYMYSGEQARLRNIAIARAIERYNLAPFVYGGQDICFDDGPICSPQTLRNLYFPYLIRAVQPLRQAGIKIIWHSDGHILPIIHDLIEEVGVAGFQGFQEETGTTLEKIASLRTREDKKLIIWGSISVTSTLPFGTVEDVKNDVERCFRTAAPGGGFALASTSSILPETPLENILTMYEHGLKYGQEFLSGR